ncbi:UDP-N-acetylmuramoyl-tripeptide--D-alanyl-D-alanine ligase [Halotalea alkalilenta]|uniref:UDP-N-acetylmuramoyl-tripeptide--D-alanyl-D- alanine ligase n=1 Tax=Halotalea alkalilenta TaxID=376489 RepID=UPI0004878BD3|nr:UDP-N-acetylmuramoyl-tripeptide--D-alanyl-D-alanine ligase [Halotalea alkalilenta]
MIDTLAQAAVAIAAEFEGDDRPFSRPITDSRQVGEGDLFFAMRGEAMDGHRFVPDALAAGAAAVVVEYDLAAELPEAAGRQLVVADTRLALGLLGGHARLAWGGPLVAVTGNSGKTTVKELVKSILEVAAGDDQPVLATQGNLNTYVGVPQTLCRLRDHHRFAVVELGANHVGEIAWTAPLARPQVAVITNVTGAHAGEFGGLARIAQAKAEVLLGLAPNGVAVLNRDDRFYPLWRQVALLRGEPGMLVDFGLDPQARIGAERIAHDDAGRHRFVLRLDGRQVGEVALGLVGLHNVRNALAASAAADALGVEPAAIIEGLERVGDVGGRMTLRHGREGRRLLDDSYNANPGAFRVALEALALQPAPRWCLMGAMAELGAESAVRHAELGSYAKHLGIDALIAYGADAAPAAEAFGGACFDDWQAFVDYVEARLPAGASVLIKGSRSMRMERLVDRLSAADAK